MINELLKTLVTAPRQGFAEPIGASVPSVGVYAVWDNRSQRLMYIGMARTGSRGRLQSHARGGRGGDQFCLYVFDRLVLPALSADEIRKAAEGQISLDARTGDYIRTHFSYSQVPTTDAAEARALEERARRGLPSVGKPLLNPL